MRRKQLIETISRIQQAITDSQLLERLHIRIVALRKPGKKVPNVGDLLAALNQFSIKMSKLTEAEKEVLKLLDLHHLNDPKNWPKLISDDHPDLLKSVFSNLRRLGASLQYFKRMIALGHDEVRVLDTDDETLSILILPDGKTTDSPKKIASIMESVQQLYNCFVTLEQISEPETLTIKALDSGIEKAIELKGDTLILEKIKELLYGVWMQVLPSHNEYLNEHLKLILKSLPILQRIEEFSSLGRMEQEKAALVKRQLTTSLEDLIRSNTIIEEMYEHWQRDPRFAMQLAPRLTTEKVEETREEKPKPEISKAEEEAKVVATTVEESKAEETQEESPEYPTLQPVNPFIKKPEETTAEEKTSEETTKVQESSDRNLNALSEEGKRRFLKDMFRREMSEP